MAPNPIVMQAVEQLGYRVTVGDVASQVGLDVQLAERDLLALASDAGGHMQVSEAGEIAYLFPKNFRDVLRNKYLRLRLQELWAKIWSVLFYIIRISFGVMLIASIALIVLSITLILLAMNSSRDGDNDNGGGGWSGPGPGLWLGPDWFWFFQPGYYSDRPSHRLRQKGRSDSELNFLESVFSFLFGDGNPNADLEERRWQAIATTIRNHGGAVVAEQITPYLDELGSGSSRELEDYMLPVLTRFNGRPEVSPDGQIIYHFPELQVTAKEKTTQSVAAYLKTSLWRFSQASAGQITLAAGLGGVNIIGALILGRLLGDGAIAAQIGGLVAFVSGIYGLLLAYGLGFIGIPLIRYFWIQWRNKSLMAQNEQRQERAIALNEADETVQQKLTFARQFAAQTVIRADNLAYTTEQDLTEQELLQADKIDEEWRRRLERN